MSKRKEVDFSDKPEADIVVNYLNKRFKKGLGTNIYVIGLPGSGKSSACQRIAELTNESRKKKNQVFIVDSLLQMIGAIKASKHGDMIIIEEVSVLFPSRRAMTAENVSIAKILDTIRKKQLCILSNAPIWKSIDSHMRALGDMIIETLKIYKTHKVVISKFHRLQTNPRSGKTYFHTFQRNGRDVNLMFTGMPNMDNWAAYERGKDKFMNELYEELQFKAKAKKEKARKSMGGGKPRIRKLTTKELKVHQLVNVQGLTQTEASRKLGVSPNAVHQMLKRMEKKTEIPKEKSILKVQNTLPLVIT